MTALPVFFLIVTGLPLQVRQEKGFEWIQPGVAKGEAKFEPTFPIGNIPEALSKDSKIGAKTWSDILVLDLRPKSGIVKIRLKGEMEAQIDAKTGEVIQYSPRINDTLSHWHDGSVWGLRLVVFPIYVLVTLLILTGLIILLKLLPKKMVELIDNLKGLRSKRTSVRKKFSITAWCFKYHYWTSLFCLLPWVVVAVSGLVLQLRYEIPGIIPRTLQGGSEFAKISFADAYEAVKKDAPELGIKKWEHVWRIYFYPERNVLSVRKRPTDENSGPNLDAQVDASNGKILSVEPRRSDLWEDIHEGKLWGVNITVFLPAHLLSFLMWITGVMMIFKKSRRAERAPIEISSQISIDDGSTWTSATIVDISTSGCRVQLAAQHSLPTSVSQITLRFKSSGRQIELASMVVWRKEGPIGKMRNLGVKFEDDEESCKQVERLIQEHSNALAAKKRA